MSLNLKAYYNFALWTSILGMLVFIYDFGFTQDRTLQLIIDVFYFSVLAVGLTSTFARYLQNPKLLRRKVFIFDFLSIIFTLYIYYMYLFIGEPFKTDLALENPTWIILAVVLSFIRELSEVRINYERTLINPAQLFILSFLIIIFIGALLLKLPRATQDGINFLDALFTSTGAVCVTGLIVVDTSRFFTSFGQSIILVLIQVGGLGILTFASYFSFFFKGGSTYENHLSLSEITNSQKIGEVFETLKYIIVITASVELVSATFIYFSLEGSPFNSFSDKAFFSIFHAISAFCNAGFSTLSNSLYETGFRFNYSLQLILIGTFVLGGLGFPIVVNIISYLKHKIRSLFTLKSRSVRHRPWVLNINSRITLITTISLTFVGFIAFYIIEYDNTLADHSFFGKIVTALFEAATPRTAGFNTVDMAALSLPAVMITLLLMLIGASPASTGGGIKTSTFAIAILNVLSLAKGKSRIEVYRREIAEISVKRAFATIALSLLVIGFGITLISIFNPEMGLLNIAFESFSAFSTVGLSLGITGDLSSPSKAVIIAIMFIGRVSMLSVMVALMKKVKEQNYRYPLEEITIN